MSHRNLIRSVIAAFVFATAGAQASEPLASEVLRSVEQVLVSQSKQMLQAAVIELKQEVEAELSRPWMSLAEAGNKAAEETKHVVAVTKY